MSRRVLTTIPVAAAMASAVQRKLPGGSGVVFSVLSVIHITVGNSPTPNSLNP